MYFKNKYLIRLFREKEPIILTSEQSLRFFKITEGLNLADNYTGLWDFLRQIKYHFIYSPSMLNRDFDEERLSLLSQLSKFPKMNIFVLSEATSENYLDYENHVQEVIELMLDIAKKIDPDLKIVA